jgi:hypothetical protein
LNHLFLFLRTLANFQKFFTRSIIICLFLLRWSGGCVGAAASAVWSDAALWPPSAAYALLAVGNFLYHTPGCGPGLPPASPASPPNSSPPASPAFPRPPFAALPAADTLGSFDPRGLPPLAVAAAPNGLKAVVPLWRVAEGDHGDGIPGPLNDARANVIISSSSREDELLDKV